MAEKASEKVRIDIKVDPDEKEWMAELASETYGVSLSQLVRLALRFVQAERPVLQLPPREEPEGKVRATRVLSLSSA